MVRRGALFIVSLWVLGTVSLTGLGQTTQLSPDVAVSAGLDGLGPSREWASGDAISIGSLVRATRVGNTPSPFPSPQFVPVPDFFHPSLTLRARNIVVP